MFGNKLFKKKKYDFYLAGPMRNYKDLNKPMFTLAAALLRKELKTVWNPSEHGSYLELSYSGCMKMDLNAIINECRNVAFLPGWRESIGANIEAFVAFGCGKPGYQILIDRINRTKDVADITNHQLTLISIDLSCYRLPYILESTPNQYNPHA